MIFISERRDIAILSRGGQGGVTMGTILAYAATYDNKYVVSIPKYGAERRGAPIMNSVKIDVNPIRRHAQIENPTDIISLDLSLVPRFYSSDVFEGDGTLTLNSVDIPSAYEIYTPKKFGTCNVSAITQDVGLVKSGSTMTAIPMLGAFIATSEIVSMDALHKAIDSVFEGSKYLQANHDAVDRTYKETKVKINE